MAGDRSLPHVADVLRDDTHRLIPSRYTDQDGSVLTRLTDDAEDLNSLFELEGATNDRLVGEAGLLPGITVRELVLGFHTRILSTPRSRMQVPSEAASTDRNEARGTRRSLARPQSWKWHTTRARNCRRSAGKRRKLLLTSISSPIFGERFTTSATTRALEVVWTQTATAHHNIWPEDF